MPSASTSEAAAEAGDTAEPMPAEATPAEASAAEASAAEAMTPHRRRREAGAPQDQAIYSCDCGFVFRAQVSTSVGCPHCGGAQAW